MNSLVEMFSYDFMIKALVVGLLLSLSAALIGVPLVLRKNSMIGDGLSHVAFGAFAIASVLGLAPLPVALPIVVLTSTLILRLGESRKFSGDAMIALISTSALALGTFAVSLAGSNVDINNYLFGSILSLGNADVVVAILLAALVLPLFVIFYHRIFAVTFDETFARSIGQNTKLYNLVFAVLCSVVIVLGMRLMGALLISALIIFPVLSAKQLATSYKAVVLSSAVISLLALFIGLVASYLLDTPTGATIVLSELAFFLCANLTRKIFKIN